MKKLILIGLILLNSTLTLKAQIYGTVIGPSGNNNVGIGSTLPTQRLTVDTKQASINAGVPANTGDIQNGIMRLQVDGNSWGEALDFGMNVVPTYAWLQATNRGNLAVNYNLSLNPNGGNIGIGTTVPSLKMVVAQDITNNNDVDAAQFGIMGSTDNRKRLVMGYDTNGDGFGFIKSGFYGVKWTNLVLQPQPNGGNVGIGTTAPVYKLDVCGTIRAKEIKVDLLGGCDFVFEKDYKLMNISTLEQFVNTNKHLPEIASEKEMVESGLNIKEFQLKLLQKIEELTLYTIEQNKQLKLQNNKIEKQNQEFKILKAKIKKLEFTKK